MKTVNIIKIAEYDPTMNGRYSMYQGYCLSTLRAIQPHIVTAEGAAASQSDATVLCSTLTRGKETALLLGRRLLQTRLLDEIRFDLSRLLSEQEFSENGSGLVRERFIAAFATDGLLERRADIMNRVRALLDYLRALPQSEIICVSHSFFMKVLEAYIETNGEVEARPELLTNFISLTKHTYPYMEGFEFKL